MKLVELAYFTDNVKPLADFYRSLLGAEPEAQSEEMAIFTSGGTRLFIHRKYPASEGGRRRKIKLPLRLRTWMPHARRWSNRDFPSRSRRRIITGAVPPMRDPDGYMVEITKA